MFKNNFISVKKLFCLFFYIVHQVNSLFWIKFNKTNNMWTKDFIKLLQKTNMEKDAIIWKFTKLLNDDNPEKRKPVLESGGELLIQKKEAN